MPTYTYTASANMPISSVSTGITLAPNECITHVKLVSANNGRKPEIHLNRIFQNGYWLYYDITDSNQNNACELINLSSPSYHGIGDITSASSSFTCSYAVANAKLKGETLYISFYGTNSHSGGDALIASDMTFIDSMVFTITTDYQSVSITSQANPSAGGTVTSISGSQTTGTEISITATPNTGYVFDRWLCNYGSFADYLNPSTTYTVGYYDDTIVGKFTPRVDNTPKAGRYNGSSYDPLYIYRYDGSKWVQCEMQRYNGSSWDNVDTL